MPTCDVVGIPYSVDEVKGYFADAFGQGPLEDYEVVGYVWNEPTMKTHAIVRDRNNGTTSEWAMDIVHSATLLGPANPRPETSVR